MNFDRKEVDEFRKKIHRHGRPQIMALLMLAVVFLVMASPSVVGFQNAAVAQLSSDQTQGATQKPGATNEKLAKPKPTQAPPKLTVSTIEKGTSSSTSPNTPKPITGQFAASKLPKVVNVTKAQAKNIEEFLKRPDVPDEKLLKNEKEKAKTTASNAVKVVTPEITISSPANNTTSTNATSPTSGNNQSSAQGPSSELVVQYSAFPGVSYSQSGGWYPPDPSVAVGPSYVLQMVNNVGAVYNKQGGLVSSFPLQNFFGTGSHFVFDPYVLYDSASGRFFAIISDGTANQIRLFVSNTNNPLSTWHGYWMQFSDLPDQARMTVSTDKIAIIASDFGSSGFTHEEIYWWGKSGVISGGSFEWSHTLVNPYYFHIQPAVAMTSASGTANWWVYSPWNGGNYAIILKSDGPVSAISFQALYYVPIAQTAIPPSATQKGSTTLVSTNDARVGSAAITGSNIVWTQNDRCTPSGDSIPRSCIRWDIVTTSGYKLQDMDIGVKGKYLFFGATAADMSTQFGVTFGMSSSTDYPSAGFAGQSQYSAYNTVDGIVLVGAGTSPETTGRHGDYASLSIDSSDPSLPYWSTEEYQTTDLWNTLISKSDVR